MAVGKDLSKIIGYVVLDAVFIVATNLRTFPLSEFILIIAGLNFSIVAIATGWKGD